MLLILLTNNRAYIYLFHHVLLFWPSVNNVHIRIILYNYPVSFLILLIHPFLIFYSFISFTKGRQLELITKGPMFQCSFSYVIFGVRDGCHTVTISGDWRKRKTKIRSKIAWINFPIPRGCRLESSILLSTSMNERTIIVMYCAS